MKKVLALLLALVMVVGMVACGGNNTTTGGNNTTTGGNGTTNGGSTTSLAGTYDVTIWVAEKAVDLTKTQIAKYNETNTDGIVINATVEPVSEADAATNMLNDVAAGADIYCFAQDQFARLVQGGALAQLGSAAAEIVKNANDKGTVSAATTGSNLYAYPLTSDNGYFMYYDKSIIGDTNVDSLEDLIAVCEKNDKFFSFETNSSAWYLASWFFATGCTSTWNMDNSGEYTGYVDTFNSDAGVVALKGMQKLLLSKSNNSSSKSDVFSANSAILISGAWEYDNVKDILGDNMGVADLPSFTVDGKEYHLGSFSGCKLMGVKPQEDKVKQAVLHKLAQYLTNEECQMQRFETLAWGPSNLDAQASDAVQAAPHLAALAQQNEYGIPQGQIHGQWWDIAKVIADEVTLAGANASDADLKAILVNYQSKLDAIFQMSEETKNAFTVIGSINGDTWTKDLPMIADGNVWTTEIAYEMDAGTEFKVRKGMAWDESYGLDGGNYIVSEAGTYYVQFDASTGVITLIAA